MAHWADVARLRFFCFFLWGRFIKSKYKHEEDNGQTEDEAVARQINEQPSSRDGSFPENGRLQGN